ncbi:MAG: DUF72 domain-containing protein [Gemmatimonadales bacterium]|jgi:uncharacterized protein YecE (DUF72 family)
MIRVGPAGWSYPDSPGHVYAASVPSRFDALTFLAPYFDTIEVNSTFYRPQPPRTYASWAKRVAANPDFRFTVKLWQLFTHGTTEARGESRVARGGSGAGEWTADDVRMVTEGLEVLRGEGRLGALLAQFPWSFKPDSRSRDRLMRIAETFAGWPLAVEVRHARWGRPEELAFLRDIGVGFANLDQPVIGQSLPPTAHATGPLGYVRFHGRNYEHWFGEHEDAAPDARRIGHDASDAPPARSGPTASTTAPDVRRIGHDTSDAPPARSGPTASATAQRYDYLYTAAELAPWIERIKALGATDGVTDVYVITNNHFEGKGPANALMVRAMLEGRRLKAPPVLFETYKSALAPYADPSEEPHQQPGDPGLF